MDKIVAAPGRLCFFRAFRMELRRALQNVLFPAGYLASLATMLMGVQVYASTDRDVSAAYLLEYAVIGSMGLLYLIWGVLPHGLSYCEDWRSGFLRQAASRCPVRIYCGAKCCAAFLSSALTMALAAASFLWILSFSRPLDNSICLDSLGYRMWKPDQPLFGPLIIITILALGSGLFSVIGLWISGYIQNIFAILASPLLLYYTQSILFSNCPRHLQFFSVYFQPPGFSTRAADFCYSCGFLLAAAALFGTLFVIHAGKERRNG